MTTPAARLDVISRPNLAGIAHSWNEVIPDDNPPLNSEVPGNTGIGCFGLYIGMEGFVRFMSRGSQFSAGPANHIDVGWEDPATPTMPADVGIMLAGIVYDVVWFPAVRASVRVWAPSGTYLWGEISHVLAHDSTVPPGAVHALSI